MASDLVPAVDAMKSPRLTALDVLACTVLGGALSARVEPIRQLLMEGRRDQSGDFTSGAGLSWEQAERILYAAASSAPSLARYRQWMQVLLLPAADQMELAVAIRRAWQDGNDEVTSVGTS